MSHIHLKVNTTRGDRYFEYSTITDDFNFSNLTRGQLKHRWLQRGQDELVASINEKLKEVDERGHNLSSADPFDVEAVLVCNRAGKDGEYMEPDKLIQSKLSAGNVFVPTGTLQITLNNCPFCGSVDVSIDDSRGVFYTAIGIENAVRVKCICCGSEGSLCKNPEEAAAAWNKRSPGNDDLSQQFLEENIAPWMQERKKDDPEIQQTWADWESVQRYVHAQSTGNLKPETTKDDLVKRLGSEVNLGEDKDPSVSENVLRFRWSVGQHKLYQVDEMIGGDPEDEEA